MKDEFFKDVDHRKPCSYRDVAVIQRVTPLLQKRVEHTQIQCIQETENPSNYVIWGVEKKQQTELVDDLRQQLFARIQGISRVVQFVGDCELFSKEGTHFAKQQVARYVSDPANLLTFGHSGVFKDGACDVNGILIDLVESNSAQTRLVSNVVNDCTKAIEQWGFRTCKSILNYMVMVYNQDGSPTLFGDDCDISDKIMQKNDVLVLMEGGAQSLLQALNALNQDAEIYALAGLRVEGVAKFSAARFFYNVIKEPQKHIEAHLQDEINQQQQWNPNKLALLEKAKALLKNPELQQKIRTVQIAYHKSFVLCAL